MQLGFNIDVGDLAFHTYVAVMNYANKVMESSSKGKNKAQDEPAMSLSDYLEKSNSTVFK